ncbi:MAG: S16 family serine protease, partial [Bacillota bacterium]|nr:S16 family serine protease [Bacillota bacterium]
PEQNKEFTDNYLEVPFDLSRVVFIATANKLSTIPRPLLDRMEVIEISGYTEDEKRNIALKYLIPKKLQEHGLSVKQCTFSEAAIREIISGYTRESGVRGLERKIADICRKVAVKIVKEKVKTVKVTERSLTKYLGNKKFKFDLVSREDQVGIVTGLAWTPVGGETLSVEVNVLDGGSGKLKITGQIGDVMRESAEAALSFIRTVTKEYEIDEEVFKTKDIHIHIPEGAIPKDGPSAGVTMATALISALSDTKVNRYVAMTGEITLRGRVLAIGGLKEKSLAAMRAGIKTVVYPAENQPDYHELPDVVKETIEFVPVKNMKQVLKIALVQE